MAKRKKNRLRGFFSLQHLPLVTPAEADRNRLFNIVTLEIIDTGVKPHRVGQGNPHAHAELETRAGQIVVDAVAIDPYVIVIAGKLVDHGHTGVRPHTGVTIQFDVSTGADSELCLLYTSDAADE